MVRTISGLPAWVAKSDWLRGGAGWLAPRVRIADMVGNDNLASEIDGIRLSLVLMWEFSDEKFAAIAAAQKSLDLAAIVLLDFGNLRFAHECLSRARVALESVGEFESAVGKIESVMARLEVGKRLRGSQKL